MLFRSVSIHHVNSEVGVIQDIDTIGRIIKKYPKTYFHVDGTQSIGKIPVSLLNVDLFSCSAHKFFGLKGSACLIKKEHVRLTPLIYGGKSQSIYRAGTPSVAVIASFAKALRLALEHLDEKENHVKKLHDMMVQGYHFQSVHILLLYQIFCNISQILTDIFPVILPGFPGQFIRKLQSAK